MKWTHLADRTFGWLSGAFSISSLIALSVNQYLFSVLFGLIGISAFFLNIPETQDTDSKNLDPSE